MLITSASVVISDAALAPHVGFGSCVWSVFHAVPPCAYILSCSVVSSSLQPRGLEPTRLLYPWDFPGKNNGVSCHSLLQGPSQPRDQTLI